MAAIMRRTNVLAKKRRIANNTSPPALEITHIALHYPNPVRKGTAGNIFGGLKGRIGIQLECGYAAQGKTLRHHQRQKPRSRANVQDVGF